MSTQNKATRQYYLDNLKVFLTVLVIFHHAGTGLWNGRRMGLYAQQFRRVHALDLAFLFDQCQFLHGTVFLISGYFVPKSYDRNGGKAFVRKKLVRLGIPLVVMGGLLSLLAGKFETGHMWFVESLLVFCLIYALIRRFVPALKSCRVQRLPLWALLAIGLVMGIGSYFIRQVSPQDHWIWPFGIIPMAIEPAHYLQYVMMFVLGVLAGRCGWLEKTDNRTGAATLAIGLLFAIGNYVRGDGPGTLSSGAGSAFTNR
jgi:Acyltransferase family.